MLMISSCLRIRRRYHDKDSGHDEKKVTIDSIMIEIYSYVVIAGITQLVEYELPKLGVAGSTPVARSKYP